MLSWHYIIPKSNFMFKTFAIPGSIFLSIVSGYLFAFPIALFLVSNIDIHFNNVSSFIYDISTQFLLLTWRFVFARQLALHSVTFWAIWLGVHWFKNMFLNVQMNGQRKLNVKIRKIIFWGKKMINCNDQCSYDGKKYCRVYFIKVIHLSATLSSFESHRFCQTGSLIWYRLLLVSD